MDPFAELEELERLAQNATMARPDDPGYNDIARWCTLFKYSHLEAYQLLVAHRSDVTRIAISDDHWELVRAEREAAGHDRESYEHSLTLKDVLKSQSTVVHDEDGVKWFVFRLGGVLESAEKVKEITGLEKVPKVTWGENEMGQVKFCWVDEEAKVKIEGWIDGQQAL
ncbi:hypothetical protein BGZ60DRAFT_402202 [Tricladium varicosporioides]|nr:hypothetical protein BGZ60DRAFT_402202 [Hymenoscyphus varicosporioides]